jgi:ATP-binding cassette, subfamily B, bacterial MsbA
MFDFKKVFPLYYQFIQPYFFLAVKALFLAILVSVLEVLITSLVFPLLQVLSNQSEESSQFLQNLNNLYVKLEPTWRLPAILFSFLLISVIKNISLYLSSISINKFRLRIGLLIRQRCIERFLSVELNYYSQVNSGELLSYVNEQAQRSETLFSHILEIIRELFLISLLLILLILLSPTLTTITLVVLVGIALLLQFVIKAVQRYGYQAAKSIEDFSVLVTELISGIRIIKAFSAEEREQQRANRSLQTRYQAEFTAYRYSSAVVPITETIGIAVLLLLLIIGTNISSLTGKTTLPFLLTYLLALLRLLPRISHLNSLRSQISLLSGSLVTINHFLSNTENSGLPNGSHIYRGMTSCISFEHVTFTYSTNSEPTLKDISLQIQRGKTTAIVGSSGSGKSTLVDLIMRFHDPGSGCITVDGIDLRKLQIDSWRYKIAMVSQDTFLFNASIRENIAYACPNATEAEIIAAAKRAYADEFIHDLPAGFDTIVGDRGTRLSGGQRQRIAIARAILRNPDILILDEATSALDTHSELMVQQAIIEVSCDRTVIIIAHRLSTIEKADQIIVLHNGEVVEQGIHQSLLNQQGQYWLLYQTQTPLTKH